MPSGLKQPVGQKRLTNIAVVRLRKTGAVFEIACYKNKVSNWRAEIETDLDEVLQTTAVFSNVSKGIMAKEKQLQDAFGTTDEEKICLEILAKGELQVSDKERKLEYDNMYKDVASIIAEKCIDPSTSRQYTATIIERALKDVHFNPDLKKSAKQQAFSEALPLLQERFSIQRANMRVQLVVPVGDTGAMQAAIDSEGITLESLSPDPDGQSFLFVCLIEPGMYRLLHSLLEKTTHGRGRMELVSLSVIREGLPIGQSSQAPQLTSSGREVSLESGEEPRSTALAQTGHKNDEEGRHVVYNRGCLSGLPDDFARKDMFMEIDGLESGWEVELTQHSSSGVVQAVFYSPSGEQVGAYARARRQALAAKKLRDTFNHSHA